MASLSIEHASYVYAVTRALDPARIAGARGVDGAEVHLVAHRDLVAVVSSVPLTEFDETALKAKLEQMEWLEAIARAHHGIVDAVAAHGAALPLRMATVYRGDDRVEQILRNEYARFSATLDQLTGRTEWGVKVYVDPTEMEPREPVASAAPAPANPGKDYLRRRKEQRRSRDDAWQQAARLGQQVDATLSALAVDTRHHRPQNPQLSGARGENVLNAAYLVDVDRARDFAERAERMNGGVPGTRVELTGPWAPYSFALPDDFEPAEAPPLPDGPATVGGMPPAGGPARGGAS